MSDEDGFKLETKNLDGLIKALKANQGRVRVGILGDKDARSSGEAKSNATLGARHEFGEGDMPVRSFLRMPLSTHLNEAVENTTAFTKETGEKIAKEGSLRAWLELLGHLGEDVVRDAFKSGGFGTWPKWKKEGYTSNTGEILVDTQQLRNSITWDVK